MGARSREMTYLIEPSRRTSTVFDQDVNFHMSPGEKQSWALIAIVRACLTFKWHGLIDYGVDGEDSN